MDTKYAKICEICGAEKVKIYDWFFCLKCYNYYRRHMMIYGYAKEEDGLRTDK